jgi:hypothetical protein
MENKLYKPIEFLKVIQALNKSGEFYAVIGGQASNLWAQKYIGKDETLSQFIPFTSKDLDIFISTIRPAYIIPPLLGCKPILNEIGSPDPVIGAFIMTMPDGHRQLTQFLNGTRGIKTEHIVKPVQTILWEDEATEIKIIHPFFSLQSKLECLLSIPQADRQDEKHAKMAVCYCACFLHERLEKEEYRNALALCELTFQMAGSKAGINAWKTHEIKVENAIPYEQIAKTQDERIQRFQTLRLPQLQAQLKSRRGREASSQEVDITTREKASPLPQNPRGMDME